MTSKDFALELFDALARRRNITGEVIDGDQLKEFWEQINDQSFDSRLKTFFDMYGFRFPIFVSFTFSSLECEFEIYDNAGWIKMLMVD